MNATGTKPLPGIATPKAGSWTSRDANAATNLKPRRNEGGGRCLRIKAMEDSPVSSNQAGRVDDRGIGAKESCLEAVSVNGHSHAGNNLSTVGNSTNIKWHDCPVDKKGRQMLLNQKGCVIWITGLSGSGKSTVACALSQILYQRGKLSYILDGDNVRHGLNRDLSFKAEDRAENIRRVERIGIPVVLCYQLEILLRCSWMFHSKFVKPETQRDYISLLVLGKSRALLVLMTHMSHQQTAR